MALKYTPELPKTPDWYWMHNPGWAKPQINEVEIDHHGPYITVLGGKRIYLGGRGWLFAGPIERPEEDSE